MVKLDRDLILSAVVRYRAYLNEKYGDALLSHNAERIARAKQELDSMKRFEELFEDDVNSYDFYLDKNTLEDMM